MPMEPPVSTQRPLLRFWIVTRVPVGGADPDPPVDLWPDPLGAAAAEHASAAATCIAIIHVQIPEKRLSFMLESSLIPSNLWRAMPSFHSSFPRFFSTRLILILPKVLILRRLNLRDFAHFWLPALICRDGERVRNRA